MKAQKREAEIASITRLIAYGNSIKANQPDSSILFYGKALEKSTTINYNLGAAVSLLRLGDAYSGLGNYNLAITKYQAAISFWRGLGDKLQFSRCFNNLGLTNYYLGNYENAAVCYDTAIRIIQSSHISPLPASLVQVYSNLAMIYIAYDQKQTALHYLDAGEKIARKEHYDRELMYIFLNKAASYTDLDTIMLCLKQAKSLSIKTGNQEGESNITANIAAVLIEQKKFSEGIRYFKEAIALGKKANSPVAVINASYSLGNAYLEMKQYARAIDVLETALSEAKQIKLQDNILFARETLALTYEANGQPTKALEQQKILVKLKDSVMNVEKATAINNLEVKYRTSQKDKELAERSLQLATQEKKLAQKNLWIWVSSLGILLLGITSGLMYRNIKHRQNLEGEQLRVMAQEQEIHLLKAMMQGEERERTRIGRELHDGIGGLLSAARMNFDTLSISNQEIASSKNFINTMQLIDEATGEVRKTAHNLMPEVLLKGGLGEAVKSFCARLPEVNGLQIKVNIYGEIPRLDPSFELSVYRIVQELIQNIIKHAKATEALVQMNWPQDSYQLSVDSCQEEALRFAQGDKAPAGGKGPGDRLFKIAIEDNGVGITAENIKNDPGIGLKNIQARIKALEGHMEIESEPGVGTAIYIEFTVDKIKPATETATAKA